MEEKYSEWKKIGTIPDHLVLELSSKSNILNLSEYTEKKNFKHQEIKEEHWNLLQKVVDQGIVVRETREQYQHHVLCFLKYDENYYLKAIIKVTKDREYVFLQSYHFVDEDRFYFEKCRGRPIKSENVKFLDFID